MRRYRRAANQKHAAAASTTTPDLATTRIGGRLTMADIKEVSAKVPVEALQAAVLELGAGGYDLNSKRLRELVSAGVPDAVIDLMVAMSFPERFVVERRSSGGGGGGYGSGYGGGYGAGFDPLWGSLSMWPYYFADPFYYSSMYSPYGYRSWGYYDPYYYHGPGVIIIDPGNGGVSPTDPSGNGRVVEGRGYTRIRRNEPDTATRTSNGNGGWGTSSTGAGSSGSSSGTSGVSSGGYSGGGASSSGGERTAVPRPPG